MTNKMAASVLTYEHLDRRVMAILSSKLEKDEEDDRLAIFKPGLW